MVLKTKWVAVALQNPDNGIWNVPRSFLLICMDNITVKVCMVQTCIFVSIPVALPLSPQQLGMTRQHSSRGSLCGSSGAGHQLLWSEVAEVKHCHCGSSFSWPFPRATSQPCADSCHTSIYNKYIIKALILDLFSCHTSTRTMGSQMHSWLLWCPLTLQDGWESEHMGTTEPGPNVNPTHVRLNALQTWKKQISHFSPSKLMKWDAMSNVGNPTKSIKVNNMIQKVMKKEVRKQGKASTAQQPTTHQEFKEAQNILMNKSRPTDVICHHGIPCMMQFQYNLIARINDTAKFQCKNLNACDDWVFMLHCMLNWSKNVNKEWDAPNQILIRAMDPFYCVLLALAIWLEIYVGATGQGGLAPYVFKFNDDFHVPEGGEKAGTFVQKILSTEIFNWPQFITNKAPLGSHSIQKLSRTHSQRNGANKNLCNIWGHWKTNRHIFMMMLICLLHMPKLLQSCVLVGHANMYWKKTVEWWTVFFYSMLSPIYVHTFQLMSWEFLWSCFCGWPCQMMLADSSHKS